MAELISKTYALALFDVAVEGDKLNEILDETKFVSQVLVEFPELYEILKTPKINTAEKKSIVDTIFKDKISSSVVNLIKIIIDKRRVKFILDIIKEYESMYLDHKKIVKASAITAIPLSIDQLTRLENKLSQNTGKTVVLENIIESDLIGGVMVKFGESVIDGSIKGKLAELESSLNKIIV